MQQKTGNSRLEYITAEVISAIVLYAGITALIWTPAGALVFLAFGINLEAWLGALISLVIIKAGVEMFSETTSKSLTTGRLTRLTWQAGKSLTGYSLVIT